MRAKNRTENTEYGGHGVHGGGLGFLGCERFLVFEMFGSFLGTGTLGKRV